MNRRRFITAAAGVGAAGLAGCFGGDETAEVDPEDIAATITANGREFDPMKVEIEEGEAVEWVNEDDAVYHVDSHDIGEASWSWDERIEPGESAAYLFEDSGVYGFRDRGATSWEMCGAVAVGDATVDDIPLLRCENP